MLGPLLTPGSLLDLGLLPRLHTLHLDGCHGLDVHTMKSFGMHAHYLKYIYAVDSLEDELRDEDVAWFQEQGIRFSESDEGLVW